MFVCLQKLRWQHVWPSLQQEMRTAEVLAAVLAPAIKMVAMSSKPEYEQILLPTFRYTQNEAKER